MLSVNSIAQQSYNGVAIRATTELLSAIIYELVPGHTSPQPRPPTPSDLVLCDYGAQERCALELDKHIAVVLWGTRLLSFEARNV